jgi:hypothetical protein
MARHQQAVDQRQSKTSSRRDKTSLPQQHPQVEGGVWIFAGARRSTRRCRAATA